jgi:Zn-dependent protease with chaperone function
MGMRSKPPTSLAFIRMRHDLATSNLSLLDPSWWQTMMFATHPDLLWRIARQGHCAGSKAGSTDEVAVTGSAPEGHSSG